MYYILQLKADTNDADYVHRDIVFSADAYAAVQYTLERIVAALKASPNKHNWECLEDTDEEDSPEEVYASALTPAEVRYFKELVPYSEFGIHTITSMVLLEVHATAKLF